MDVVVALLTHEMDVIGSDCSFPLITRYIYFVVGKHTNAYP